jgi:hypothetical protein
MNQRIRVLLSPYAMVAVIVSNFVFVLSSCSSNAIGQDSNFEGIESLKVYDTGELVIIPLVFLILIVLLMWLLRSLKNGRKRRRLFTAQTKRLVLKSQNFKCLICRTNVGPGIITTRMETEEITNSPIVKPYVLHVTPKKAEA